MSTPRKTSPSRRPSSITSAARKRPKRSASAETLAKRKAAAKARKAATAARQRERAKAQRSAQTTRKRAAAAAKRQRDRERARAAAVDTRPPSSPIIPCDDPYVGQQFNARVNCKPYTTLSGKVRQRCDTQRVVVVGCATPPAGQPRRKQLFAAQTGSRYTVPDQEIRRDLRLAGRPVEAPARRRRSDAADIGGDTSFDFKANGRKFNHHGGHHEPGDPLGAYMPPVRAWRQSDRSPAYGSGRAPHTHYTWRHPSLPLTFDLVHHRASGTTEMSIYQKLPDSTTRVLAHGNFGTLTQAYDYVKRWYATQTERELHSVLSIRKSNPSYNDRGGRICDYCHNSKAPGVRVLSCPYGECPSKAACKSCAQTHRQRWTRAAHAACAARGAKPNRAPAGAVPGQTYFDRRADPLLGRRVSGERYAGEVRVRAVGADGRTPSHVVGGHILPRSRVRAGVIREEIRAGLRPAPVRRQRPAASSTLLLGPGSAEPGRSFVQRFGTGGGAEPGRSFVQRFGTGGGAEPLRPRAPASPPAKKPRAVAKKGPPTNEELFRRLQEKLRKTNRRRSR